VGGCLTGTYPDNGNEGIDDCGEWWWYNLCIS